MNVEFSQRFSRRIRQLDKTFFEEQEAKAKELRSAQLQSADRAERQLVHAVSVKDFSKEAIKLYLNKTGTRFDVPSRELWLEFRKSGVLSDGDRKSDFTPTVAGLVVFGKTPDQFLPQARIKLDFYDLSFNEPILLE